jgi:regulator of PEP synthase PpsR (kinase-PPPase family)
MENERWTPTSIYLALRGYKTANVLLVPELLLPESLLDFRSRSSGGVASKSTRT